MDKAALYIRLSKEDVDKEKKGDDSESIVNQRLLLMNYAIEHQFSIVDVYSDEDYSGLYDDRPAFDRLIQDCKMGKINVVIAKTQSRFTRNMEHMEKYLHHIFPVLGIRFIGVVDGVDTQSIANKKSRQINGLVNEWYCEDLSNNIKAVFKQKMRAGQFLAGFAPYGYQKDPCDHHKLVVDEYAATVVKRIFSLYLKGYSHKKIAAVLEDEKILSPTAYKKNQGLNYVNTKANEFSVKYGFWSETTIKRILSNETYIGTLVQGTCTKASYKDKKVVAVPKEEWIVVENHHEPIIEIDTFQKVADIRKKRRICTKQGTVHLFAGKLRCATCKHTMIKSGGVRNKEGDWFLRCQLANKSRMQECTSHSIRFSIVEEVIKRKIQMIIHSILSDLHYARMIEATIKKTYEKNSLQEEQTQLNKLEAKSNTIMKTIRTLYTDRIGGCIEEEVFFQLKKDCEEELNDINQQKAKIVKKIEQLKEQENFDIHSTEWKKIYIDDFQLTYEMICDFVQYIEIGEKNRQTRQQEITIYWNF